MNNQNMGVLNITPNSFSDGGQYNNLESFKIQFKSILKWASIVDIGAESTAPFNEKISSNEELIRFKNIFFPILDEWEDPQTAISIDTYKVDVFLECLIAIKKKWPKTNVIFNDVSGAIDKELVELLADTSLDFQYVYCHNRAPQRSDTQNHMKYLDSNNDMEFFRECIQYFKEGLSRLSTFEKRVIIDPCFGFSKTKEQNIFLLKNIKTFLLQFPENIDCMIGISRKSFLRDSSIDSLSDNNKNQTLDTMQSIIFYELMREKLQQNLIFRVHDPLSFECASRVKNIFDI